MDDPWRPSYPKPSNTSAKAATDEKTTFASWFGVGAWFVLTILFTIVISTVVFRIAHITFKTAEFALDTTGSAAKTVLETSDKAIKSGINVTRGAADSITSTERFVIKNPFS